MANEPTEVGAWLRQQVLGSGGFGVVTLWKHKEDGNMIAIKKCRWGADSALTPKHKERWTNEVDIMQRLNHRGVVRALPVPPELEQALRGELPLLCMEYCSRGDLRQVLNRAENCCGLKEATVRALLRDVTSAVDYLHANKITHRDLKPENIVLQGAENNKVTYKLIDLGYAKELDQSSMCASFVGTLQYLAPELFLSQKYSCSVDYWSLGLVAHEAITGVRPFIPDMAPVAWMVHVQRKSQDDICAYENEDGTITFSSQLNPHNHISTCLQYSIEGWLRLLLDWDPKRRGRISADSDQLLVFSSISSILEKKVVPVYCVPTAQILSYEVDDSTELATLQGWIFRDTKIPVEDQELLLPRGTKPDPSLPANQCCPPNENVELALFVLQRGRMELPDVKPNVPLLVGQMIKDARSPVEYSIQKKAWAHAVFFLHQEANLYANFLRAYKAKIVYVLSRARDVGKLNSTLAQEKQSVTGRHQLFAKSLDLDVSKSQQIDKSQVKDLSVLWIEEGVQLLKRLQHIESVCTKIESDVERIGARALQIQRSPLARIQINSSLDGLAQTGETCYEALRRRSRELRQTPQSHADMARVVYNCLKQRDKLLHDEPFIQHLKEISTCQLETDKVMESLNNLLKQLATLKQEVDEAQIQRQTEIWTLLTSEIARQVVVAPEVPVRDSSKQPIPPARGAIPKQPTQTSANKSISLAPKIGVSPQLAQRRPAAASVLPPSLVPVPHNVVQVPQSLTINHMPQHSVHNFQSLQSSTLTADDIIKENKNLRYMTQQLLNESFVIYKEYLNSSETLDRN